MSCSFRQFLVRRQGACAVKPSIVLLRATLTALLSVCLWNAATAKAAAIEYLMVPSAAMGRDIPVALLADPGLPRLRCVKCSRE
jgi:hypothetical protein